MSSTRLRSRLSSQKIDVVMEKEKREVESMGAGGV